MLDLAFLTLLLIFALALVFDFINGFHDAANAIATVVSTRVLAPRTAILMAGILNFVGALSGTAVAKTVGAGLAQPESVTQVTIVAALLSAIIWNLLTWYYAIPSSSSHALIAGVVGAALATGGPGVLIWSGLEKVLLALLVSPVLGFVVGLALMIGLLWAFRRATPVAVGGIFRNLQVLSAAFMAFSHGSNDAQKTMGIMTMSLVVYGALTDFAVPVWVMVLAAVSMGLGTAAGGWRIIRTVGHKLVALQPIHGFAAETSAATVIEIASRLGFPLSTTHVISATILGVGSSKRLSAVRWGVAGNIVFAWVLTLPACAFMGWIFVTLFRLATRT